MTCCENCKHHEAIMIGEYRAANLCRRRIPLHDIVTGAPVQKRYDCRFERAEGWLFARLEGLCGREGRFFEPKEVMP